MSSSSQVDNEQVLFNEIPTGAPIPGKTMKKVTTKIDLSAKLPTGSVLLKTMVLSLDPYLRGRMRDVNEPSYSEAYPLGKPMTNFGVSEVIKSANKNFKKGDKVYYAGTEFATYSVVDEEGTKGFRILENKENLPWTNWVGMMPLSTAWWGLKNIVKPQKGETIFVNAASGAVGQMVIALSKIAGLKVIATAGSDEKVAFLKEIGADVTYNYKTESTVEILKQHPFEIFWDNVGGKMLDDGLGEIKEFGRVVSCGAIAGYNGQPVPVTNVFKMFSKSLLMQGFIIIKQDTSDFWDEIPPLIGSGKIRPLKENIIHGLDNGEAFTEFLAGETFGKPVISLM